MASSNLDPYPVSTLATNPEDSLPMASLLIAAVPVVSQYSALSFSQSVAPPPSTSLSSRSPVSAALPIIIYCGKGDKKTERGKRFNHSFGNSRPKDKKKGRGPPRVPTPLAPPRKDRYDNEEVGKIEIDESLG